MFKRMKKMLKKEKGFTLVELLAVIAILGIIVAIAVPTIGNLITNSETKAKDANEELFENAARLAYTAGYNTEATQYTLSELVDAGYLDEIPNVPGTDSKYDAGVEIKDGSDANGGKVFEFDDSIDDDGVE
ncbi:competence type IV pilus major pilin ComGC [Oceanobacillus halophilus]|uniref:Type II secretion system protein n=1 Tax=Oceanobacillus halophilus TaxID=930130 RepID=A0A494ZV77_9BACI|nr:type II secretion system protein [Oceanobacillus halophilus]RKQ29888.1 type II secretion system protein [Oceanobacillus halophilus]